MKTVQLFCHPVVMAGLFLLGGAVVRNEDEVAAQEPPDTFALDPIVVTATRLPTPRSAVPAAVTVIEGAAVRATGVRTVADALRMVPGLSVARSGSIGGLTSLFVRGAESDHVQILIDGVPVNDPGGAVDLANLDLGDVARIEVVRGPASVLYGTDAAAGVIQIFTRKGEGPVRLETRLGGSRTGRAEPGAAGAGGLQASASVSGGGTRAQWGFTAARSEADGVYTLNNRFVNTTLSGVLDLRPSGGTGISVSVRRGVARFNFPTDGGGALVDANQFRESESLATGIEASHVLGRVELRTSVSSTEADYVLDDAPDDAADTLGVYASSIRDRYHRRRFDLHANFRTGRSTITAGASLERQRGKSRVESSSSFGPYEDTSDNERSSRAGYVQLVTAPRSGLTVTAGTRLERSDRYGSLPSWRAGFNLRGHAGWIRLVAGVGFKEPTFFENYATGFVHGNPDLEPERTRSAELGLARVLAGGRARIEATAFVQQLRDLIQFTAGAPAGSSNYFNIGEARATGLEIAGSWDPSTTLGFDVGLTLLRTRVTDAGFGEDRAFLQDQPLLRRPSFRLSAQADWHPTAGRLSLRVGLTGRREDLDFSDPTDFAGTRTTMPAYALMDLAFERTLLQHSDGQRLGVRLHADNIFDRRYEEIRNFPAPGRTIGIGMTWVTGF